MKAPKNFYNTVDQSKLGIDELFTRMAEAEEKLLPDAESSDEGKVAIVDSTGNWVLGNAGTNDFFVIHATRGTGSSGRTRLGIKDYATWGEAATAAIASGKIVLVVATQEYDTAGYTISDVFIANVTASEEGSSTQPSIKIVELFLLGNPYQLTWIAYANSQSQSLTGQNTSIILPYVAPADNGKVLLASGGNWTKGNILTLPASSTSDAGKILMVNSSGVAEWVTPTP